MKNYKKEMHEIGVSDRHEGHKPFDKIQIKYQDLEKIKSVYIWGDPGCGKSFIMEQFFESLELPPFTAKFLHYQEFMLQIHELEHKINKKLKGRAIDTINEVGN